MVYLDNAATTRVCPEAAEAAAHMMTECFGNPSTTYKLGREAKAAVDKARGQIAKALGCQPDEVYFTSCGSEGDNWALISGTRYMRRRGKHIISSAVEHDAVRKSLDFLEKEGYEITRLQPDGTGAIPLERVRAALRPDTILVSLMMVNNETGAVNDIAAVARMLKAENSIALLHTDAVQGFCKIPLQPKKLGVDLISVSGHKVHAPKGVGALYVKSGVRILPHSFGGGQEKNLRPGTEGVPQICAFGEAVKHMMTEKEALTHVKAVQAHLIERLKAMPEVVLNSPENALPYIVNLSAGRVRAETMLHFLAERNIFVSSGSACGKAKPSHVLSAMQLPKERVETSLRVSLSAENTAEEMDAFADALKEGLQTLSHA